MKYLLTVFIAIISIGYLHAQTHADTLINILQNPQNKYVLVSAHRGDWRNNPENSLQSLKGAIEMGVDIAELDLKKTKDGVLIIMHDKTIDRSTNGKGKPEDYTLEEIKKFRLKNGLGRNTDNSIPTFKEYLEAAKGKILIDIDKGYDYFQDAIVLLKETGTLKQAMINIDDNVTFDEVEARYGKVPEDIMIMPIVVFNDIEKAHAVIASYLPHKNTIFQIVWRSDKDIHNEDFCLLRNKGYGIWLNSLWASLNGGHDDDKAVELGQKEETWGWLINRGATIIQTDRPYLLLQYLKQKNLHK